MRPLSETEKKLNLKAILKLEERNAYLGYLQKYNKLMVDEGLEVNFKKQVGEFKESMKEIAQEISMNENKMKLMREQNEKGVEEKTPHEHKEHIG